MLFGRKKPAKAGTEGGSAPQVQAREPEGKDRSTHDDVFSDALSFETSRIEEIQKSERMAWRVAQGFGLTTILAVGAVALLTPLKTTVPYVIQVDNATGRTQILELSDQHNIPVSEVMDRYWLGLYVKQREGYDWQTIENDFKNIRELSMPNVFQGYFNERVKEGANLDKILGPMTSWRIELISVVPTGNGIATVRFIRKEYNNYDGVYGKQTYWTATISYEYLPSYKVSDARRLINPLGFKVTSYRVDQDFVRAPRSADELEDDKKEVQGMLEKLKKNFGGSDEKAPEASPQAPQAAPEPAYPAEGNRQMTPPPSAPTAPAVPGTPQAAIPAPSSAVITAYGDAQRPGAARIP